jgi:hypothetical protein
MVMTVQIKPQAAFANGKRMVATQFNVVSIGDNLFDSVVFKYTLMDADGAWAGESTFSLDASNYTTWDATPAGAYKIVAAGIGVEIIEQDKKVTFNEVA